MFEFFFINIIVLRLENKRQRTIILNKQSWYVWNFQELY